MIEDVGFALMLFDTSLRRELGRSFAATLLIVLTIVLTMLLIRMLGQAASGSAAPEDVVLLLCFAALGHLPTIMALALFVAVVLTLGRWYRDSEMPVWFASGVGVLQLLRPLGRATAPLLAVIALLAIWVWPWVNARTQDLRERHEQRSDVSRVSPGLFQSSADGNRVFFVDRDNAGGGLARNVFIVARSGQSESVTSARTGRLEVEADGDRHVVLERGQRSEVDAATGEKSLASFDTYRVWFDEDGGRVRGQLPVKAQSTATLLRERDPVNDGELAWRFGLALAACNLVLLGAGLSEVRPRRISNWNLLLALLTFVVVLNLVNLSKSWVASGKLGLGPAMVWLHGGMLVLALALLWWRDRGATLRLPRLPLRRR